KQIKRITGKQPEILIADRGYRGQKEFGKTRLLTPSAPLKSDSQYNQRRQRKRFRKRAGLGAQVFKIGSNGLQPFANSGAPAATRTQS
ncbi:MAG: hypothetical protein QF537_16115, partial [SAR324 cluster bacterium]|nr:hypothetical protein [SAR324 cluster bacterium]